MARFTSCPGARTSPGKSSRKSAERRGAGGGQGVVAGGGPLDPDHQLAVALVGQGERLPPGRKARGVSTPGGWTRPGRAASDGAPGSTRKSNDEGELRAPEPVRPLAEVQVELEPLAGADPHLRDDVRRVRRAADAVGPQVGRADLRVDPEDQLDRVGEVELVVESRTPRSARARGRPAACP